MLVDNIEDVDLSTLESGDIFDDPDLLCLSTWRFRENTCTAEVDDGQMYAIVYAFESSDYELRMVENCTTELINNWAYRGLTDYYLFADQVPVVNPSAFDRTEDLIEQVRFNQIGGDLVSGNLHTRLRHNNDYSRYDFEENFPSVVSGPLLGLSRLMVLTTNSTASASESLINTLAPYMDVITFGSKTLGKPFRSYDRQFCGKSLTLMQVERYNANFVSVAGGLEASCYAQDDLDNAFGLQSGAPEGMFQSALDYIASGRCDTAPIASARHASKANQIRSDEVEMIGDLAEPSARQ